MLIENHIEVLSSHTRGPVTLNALMNLWVDAYVDLRGLNGKPIDTVNDMEEFSMALSEFSEIFGKIISDQEKNIRNSPPIFKKNVLETDQALREIKPLIRDICAEVETLKEKRDLLKARSVEFGELQVEQSSLASEIERLDRPELGELDKLRGEIESLSKERDDLALEQERLTDEKNGLVDTCTKRDTENRALKKEVENLIKAIRDITAEIELLEEQQAEGKEKYKTLEQDKDALNPEQLRKDYEELLNEARPLLSSWKALKLDPLFKEVFPNEDAQEDIQDEQEELHRVRVEVNELMPKLKEIETGCQNYGKLLAKWEEVF